jgi:hypothetical protein
MSHCKHDDLEVPITDDGRCGQCLETLSVNDLKRRIKYRKNKIISEVHRQILSSDDIVGEK